MEPHAGRESLMRRTLSPALSPSEGEREKTVEAVTVGVVYRLRKLRKPKIFLVFVWTVDSVGGCAVS
jgi:hypothetical protein